MEELECIYLAVILSISKNLVKSYLRQVLTRTIKLQSVLLHPDSALLEIQAAQVARDRLQVIFFSILIAIKNNFDDLVELQTACLD
jgi:hypothetical protein